MGKTTYVSHKTAGPCEICGRPTRRLDYYYAAYICSDECRSEMDKKYQEAETKALQIGETCDVFISK